MTSAQVYPGSFKSFSSLIMKSHWICRNKILQLTEIKYCSVMKRINMYWLCLKRTEMVLVTLIRCLLSEKSKTQNKITRFRMVQLCNNNLHVHVHNIVLECSNLNLLRYGWYHWHETLKFQSTISWNAMYMYIQGG